MPTQYKFQPDYVVPPGETLKETLEMLGLSQADLAVRTGLAEKTVSQIVNGLAPITYDTAEKLEFVTGVPASFWNRRELTYREGLFRQVEKSRLVDDVEWLKSIPVDEIVSRGFIAATDDKVELVRRVLKFFGVSSVASWHNTWSKPAAQYRGGNAQQRHPGYVAAWLRMGELQASKIDCEAFDAREFRRALHEIRGLTLISASEWRPRLHDLCGQAGVCFVLTKEISRASLSGAARWLTKDKALIQLSLKYKSDDQFWFSFFHEAGHILLHGKRKVFVDYGMSEDSEEELEAHAFAREILIPPDSERALLSLRTKKDIMRFAATIGIAPGIVVGRLQFEKIIKHSDVACNSLKVKYEWA